MQGNNKQTSLKPKQQTNNNNTSIHKCKTQRNKETTRQQHAKLTNTRKQSIKHIQKQQKSKETKKQTTKHKETKTQINKETTTQLNKETNNWSSFFLYFYVFNILGILAGHLAPSGIVNSYRSPSFVI